ncbi:hypothetical protein GCM10023221_04780 [Luteimicrobium xylanilyticum]|uniref:Uncharacterized protein n=1 Tax=Luteimicrobium xylanilyticum TaxID=1133546 RepID=A0A5P9Q7Z8_9MICO|nr:hypothetical protein [Luteimicrobium xylanilyticum]QFU97230.1 hypothetical protein KDY119_00724 [Luteimicrobium xylanilyticum]
MSFEALFQAETLHAQQEAERRRAAHLAEPWAARAGTDERRTVRVPRRRSWPSLHLPHRHARPARHRARLAA